MHVGDSRRPARYHRTMTRAPQSTFTPTPSSHRLDALDVLRGFALIGICVANVEFFNRPVVESGQGIPAGLHGLDRVVAFLVAYFVSGKFWTIFSLLFGMGFALMLERAQAAGRPFLPVYGRRIAVLLGFGLLHHSLLWSGDILISYAIGAMTLLLTLMAPPRALVAAFLLCAALTLYPGFGFAAWAFTPILFAGAIALYLRAERGFWFAALAVVPGALMLLAAFVTAIGDGAADWPLAVAGLLLVALGLLAWRYRAPQILRPLRAGVTIVMLTFALIALDGGMRYFAPDSAAADSASVTSTTSATSTTSTSTTSNTSNTSASGETASAGQTEEARYREQAARSREEERVLTANSYPAAVAMRIRHLDERLRDEIGFSVLLLGVFLVGVWFVRSGVIAHAGDHLPLLRRLAWAGVPFGVGLGLLGSLISTGRPAGVDDHGYDFANALAMLGSLPAALGYIAAVLLMLHSRGVLAQVRVLAPFGRMALTNYLAQSLVFALLFYGHGLGWWGIARTTQVGIALLLCAVQIGLSHWWLARFQYGPAEWLWRALTYLTWPRMRASSAASAAPPR